MPRYIDVEKIPNDSFWEGMTPKEKAKVLQWFLQTPAADVVEVKHGRWKKIQNYALCSNCKHEVNWGCKDFLSPYCPKCGAKMDKECK